MLAISLALLGVLEGLVRLFRPQDVRTLYVNGLSLAVADPDLGFVLRPLSHARDTGPEFTAEYVISEEGLRDAERHAVRSRERDSGAERQAVRSRERDSGAERQAVRSRERDSVAERHAVRSRERDSGAERQAVLSRERDSATMTGRGLSPGRGIPTGGGVPSDQGQAPDGGVPSGRGCRVLLVGDSFTFGKGCDYEEIWPVLLEKGLRERGLEVELIKAGVPGYDTRKEVLYLERLLDRYAPDVVLLTFLPNDLLTNVPIEDPGGRIDGRPEGTAPARSPATSASAPAMSARSPVNSASVPGEGVRVAIGAQDKSASLHLVTLARRLLLGSDRIYRLAYERTARTQCFTVPPSSDAKRRIAIAEALLARGLEASRASGARFAVISIPQQFQVLAVEGDHPSPSDVPLREPRSHEHGDERASPSRGAESLDVAFVDETLGDYAREHGFVWIALLPQLADRYRSGGEDLYYRLDGHLNAAGNRAVAEALIQKIPSLLASSGAARCSLRPE